MKEVTKEVYLKWYEDMLLGESLRTNFALYIQQKVRILHLYNGQEGY
jgi:pyruvate dehydrogenase E1 component alpha subunit